MGAFVGVTVGGGETVGRCVGATVGVGDTVEDSPDDPSVSRMETEILHSYARVHRLLCSRKQKPAFK